MAGRKGRKGNGEGNIRQRLDGRWEARLVLVDGHSKSFYGKTRQEVARALAALTHTRDQGQVISLDERQTVGQYLTNWLEIIRPTVKPKTYRVYEYATRVHLIPGLGRLKLTKLSPQHIQTLWASKLEEELSPTSVHHFHAVLHKAVQDAYRLGIVQRNVCELVDPPRMAAREMHVLDEKQVRILLDAARGDRLEALYVLALATGMRQGELLGLHWREVDLERGHLQVRYQLQKMPHQAPTFESPKTKRSRRKIALPTAVIEALHQHRARQLAERLALGSEWEELDLVFCNTEGHPLDPTHLLRRQFYPLLKRAGLPIIHFHDLRHTAATLFLLRSVHPKVVSEVLGHSSVAITLDIYSHVLPDMQDQATAVMDAIISSR